MNLHKRIGTILVCVSKGSCINDVYLKNRYDESCNVTVITTIIDNKREFHITCQYGDIDETFKSEEEFEKYVNENFVEISSQICPSCENLCSVVLQPHLVGNCCKCNHYFGETDCQHLHCPKCSECVQVRLTPKTTNF